MSDLRPVATIHLGKTADWVAITADAVWVGSTGPNAVSRIDPRSNARVAHVLLPGTPCAGLATGFGSLWVPLCTSPSSLARVNLESNAVTLFPVGPAMKEGGITTSSDSVWMIIDASGTLARIDPDSGDVTQRVTVSAGSFNPHFSGGLVWVTHAAGSGVTAVSADTGAVHLTVGTGPGPRFLTGGGGFLWTLNQGDGSLTRIDAATRRPLGTIPLHTPGSGGDLTYGMGMVWATAVKTPLSVVDARSGQLGCQWRGTGGDSLGVGYDSVWLTDYHAGNVLRLAVSDVLHGCEVANSTN